MPAIILLILFAYVLGSIPTGYWLVKALKGVDIRTIGSGSTGTTNVLRAAGKTAALVVLLVDIAKGYIPVYLGVLMEHDFAAQPHMFALLPADTILNYHLLAPIAALAAIIGHSKSIFLNFQGGKSAATGLGTLLGMQPAVGGLVFAFWILLVWSTRYVSLASIIAVTASTGVMAYFNAPPAYDGYCVLATIFVIARHKANVGRLLKGTEPKLGQKQAQVQDDTSANQS